MKELRYLLSAAVVAALFACAPAGSGGTSDSATMAADMAAANAVRDKFVAAFSAGDAAGIAALYTTDGLSQGNMQPTSNGADAIAATNKAFFDMYTIQNLSLTPVKTEVSGNLGYDIGTFSFVGVPKAKGDTLKAAGRYMVVLRKGPDGTWKAIADMDNSATPMMPPPPPKK